MYSSGNYGGPLGASSLAKGVLGNKSLRVLLVLFDYLSTLFGYGFFGKSQCSIETRFPSFLLPKFISVFWLSKGQSTFWRGPHVIELIRSAACLRSFIQKKKIPV
jgi:hypothetical protein